MTVAIEKQPDGSQVLVIRLPMNNPPMPSSTGKNLIVATSSGNLVTPLQVNGKNVVVGVNAYVKA